MSSSVDSLVKQIQKTGLPEKEAIVYGYILSVQGAFPSDIASHTKLNRSTVYKVLTSLSIKGLVAEVEKKKKLFYQAEPPRKIKYYTHYKLEEAQNASLYAQELVPILESMFNKSSGAPRVTFYEGKEQVIEAYLRHVQVEKGYKMTAFASVLNLKAFLPDKVFSFYKKEKERLGITARGVTSAHPYSFEFQKDTYRGIKKSIWPELRFIPEEIFPFPAEITMFDSNKVSIVKFDDHHPIGIIIEDKMVHDMMNMIFELVWKQSEKK